MRKLTLREAINEAFDEELARDPTVFIMGEDVGMYGGVYGLQKGLFRKYGPERVRDTPISETAIIGATIGAAVTGLRPIAEIMYASFLPVCWEELTNGLTKQRYMSGGQVKLPVTIPCMSGGGMCSGAGHEWSPEGMLMGIPGLKIVTASTPYDAKGLLKSAIRDDNPVIFFFNYKMLATDLPVGEVPEGEYTIPLGKADIKREGSDVTVIATARMVYEALDAAAELQEKSISIEIIDPRTLVPLDKQAIFGSLKKTGRLVIMTEECKTGSSAGEISAILNEEAFDLLDAPIKRVNAPDTPPPSSPVLENFFTPDKDDLIKAVTDLL